MSQHHLIVGGQRSGKSRHAESLAMEWLRRAGCRRVSVIATARPADEEMRERIERHQRERPVAFDTVEAPLALANTLRVHDDPTRLLLVDCLTLWLTNWLMPADEKPDHAAWCAERDALTAVLRELRSPVVMVSNEVGWGVVPMSRQVREFVDELGRLNQAAAACCGRVTLMVAGQAWTRGVGPACIGGAT